MENFVDNIIKTDKKARAVIDGAQVSAKNLLAMTKVDAERERERLIEAQQKEMEGQDVKMKESEKLAIIEADNEYLKAKKKMDKIFNANVDKWEKEIINAVLCSK